MTLFPVAWLNVLTLINMGTMTMSNLGLWLFIYTIYLAPWFPVSHNTGGKILC